ncbi:MAG: YncE family protein [Nitriliruptor sp.]|nr:MAG: YncE family protein [Nitriliruptor sp.]
MRLSSRSLTLSLLLTALAVAVVAGAIAVVGGGSTAPVIAAGPSEADAADAADAGGGDEPRPEPPPESPPEPADEPDPEPAPEPDDEEDDGLEAEEEASEPAEPVLPPGPPSDERTLSVASQIGGDISPKSVVASPGGLFLAQNMMYRHTITVYDRDQELLATIADTVNPASFGLPGPDADVRGAPVEAAFTPDGRYAYVSNYAMYGPGYDRPGTDTCSPADGYDDSTLYRVDLDALAIDQVIPVGSVPKYVAVTPDGSTVLVTNWCSYDLSIVDVATGTEVERLDLGRYPRGIAITPDAATAYIALMGTFDVLVLDLEDRSLDRLSGIGRSPRHLVLSPDGDTLYATINGEGVVARIDLATEEVIKITTGEAPRSMDIAADGRSLYVVNYFSDTVSKVRTSDMTVLQTIDVANKPIGITYDRGTGQVWVASYSGVLTVLDDR